MELGLLTARLDEFCTGATCPQMKATDEWIYLCAAHSPPKECCAIDYIIHTIDWTTAMLNNSKLFHSRVTIDKSSAKHFQSIARRLYRVFAHAYFHHYEVFVEFERERRLCERFTKFINQTRLVASKLQIIPSDFRV